MSQANHFIGGWDGWKHGQNKTSGTPTSLMIGYCRAKPTVALFCHPNTKRCYRVRVNTLLKTCSMDSLAAACCKAAMALKCSNCAQFGTVHNGRYVQLFVTARSGR